MSAITQNQDAEGLRFYSYLGENGLSVTRFIGLFKDESWKTFWKKNIENKIPNRYDYTADELSEMVEKKAESIAKAASNVGNKRHNEIERCLIEGSSYEGDLGTLHPDLLKFLTYCKPCQSDNYHTKNKLAIELPVFLKKNEVCLGGTVDAVLTIKGKLFRVKRKKEISEEEIPVVVDWKFPGKYKSPSFTAQYFLQLAVYREAIEYTYGTKIDNAILCTVPTSESKIYPRWLDKNDLDYLSSIVDDMIECYKNDKVDSFNWKRFVSQMSDFNCSGSLLNNVQYFIPS